MEDLEKKLELSRLELLDMGLRGNSLLHCRPRAKTLEVIDEVASEIYHILVDQQRAMTFVAIPDSLVDENDRVDDSQPLPALLEEMYGDARHTDNKLQTKLTAVWTTQPHLDMKMDYSIGKVNLFMLVTTSRLRSEIGHICQLRVRNLNLFQMKRLP